MEASTQLVRVYRSEYSFSSMTPSTSGTRGKVSIIVVVGDNGKSWANTATTIASRTLLPGTQEQQRTALQEHYWLVISGTMSMYHLRSPAGCHRIMCTWFLCVPTLLRASSEWEEYHTFHFLIHVTATTTTTRCDCFCRRRRRSN